MLCVTPWWLPTHAFVVRMTLIPALMYLMGDKAWWLPRWLDRIVPNFSIEGDEWFRERDAAAAAEGEQRAGDGHYIAIASKALLTNNIHLSSLSGILLSILAVLLWPFILGAALCRLLGFHIPGIDIT